MQKYFLKAAFGAVPGMALAVLALLAPLHSIAQSPFDSMPNLFTIPRSYTVSYTGTPPVIDGDINDAVWQKAAWTDDFVDIEGSLKPLPPLRTRARMLWDDSCLYIAAELIEPDVWARLKQHDTIVYHDNDFEIFIDPKNTTHRYFELEFNAFNTVFDLFLDKPYRDGGSPLITWDAKGLRSAVQVQGTLNHPGDTDKSWTVEIAIPFKALNPGHGSIVPHDGSFWRINFSRVEWGTHVVKGKYVKLKDGAGRNLPEHNWVWSPQGVINMHYPERWGYLLFSKDVTNNRAFVVPYSEQQKRYLWLIYYSEKHWYQQHKAYTHSLRKLRVSKKVKVGGAVNHLYLEADAHQFIATIQKDGGQAGARWMINDGGLVSAADN